MSCLERFSPSFGTTGTFSYPDNWKIFKKMFEDGKLYLPLLNCNYVYNCRTAVYSFLDCLTEQDLQGIVEVDANNISDKISVNMFLNLFRKLNPANELKLIIGNNHSWNQSTDLNTQLYVSHIFQIALEREYKIDSIHAHSTVIKNNEPIRNYFESPFCKITSFVIGGCKIDDWNGFYQNMLYLTPRLKILNMDFYPFLEQTNQIGLEAFLEFLRTCELLKDLSISFRVGNNNFKRICESLASNPNMPLRKLRMCNDNKISKISPLISIMHSLESLHWSNGFGAHFEELVNEMRNLKSLCIYTDIYRPHATAMTIDQMQYLFSVMTYSHTIENLSILGYGMEGVSNLFSFIEINRSIRELRFNKKLEYYILEKMMKTIVMTNTTLRKLSVSDIPGIYGIQMLYEKAKINSKPVNKLMMELEKAKMTDSLIGQVVSLYPMLDLIRSSFSYIPEDFILDIRRYE
jgi:hypothetical protein